MQPFRLFSLPDEELQKVLAFFPMIELVELSCCSSKARQVVSNHAKVSRTLRSLRRTKPLEILVELDEEKCQISPNGVQFTGWEFNCRRWSYRYDTFKFCENRAGMTFSKNLVFNQMYFHHVGDYPPHDALKFVKYLVEVLHFELECLRVETFAFDKEFGLAHMDLFRDLNRVIILSGSVSQTEMTMILDDYLPTIHSSVLSLNPGPNYHHSHPISGNYLSIFESHWFTIDMLLNIDCKGITIVDFDVSNEELREFVVQWMESDNTKLEFLRVEHYSRMSHITMCQDAITEGIETKKGTAKNYVPHLAPQNLPHRLNGSEYQFGLEIRRKDGLLATVLVQEDEDEENFYWQRTMDFAVWHKENASVVENL